MSWGDVWSVDSGYGLICAIRSKSPRCCAEGVVTTVKVGSSTAAPGGKLLLNRALVCEQPVHGVAEIVFVGLGHAEVLRQRGAVPLPGGGQLGVGTEDTGGDHGQHPLAIPRFRAEVSRWERAGVAAPWTLRLWVPGGTVARHPDPSVQRFVGTPSMASPARILAAALNARVASHPLSSR